MNILVIPVQSVSDLITNSSSEVFILETGKTCEEVNTILNTFTSGFRHPEVFSLKDFREWRKKLRSGEIEDDWSYPGTIFSIADGWFKDPEDEEDLLNLRMDFLFDPFDTIDYGNGHCWIEKVRARNFSDAQQKFINAFTEDYEDIDIPSDWEDLITILNTQADIVIGDIYDIEEF